MLVRKWRLGVVAVAVLAALTACSASGGDPGGSGDAGAGEPGGTLRVGTINLPPGQGNPFTSLGSPGVYTWSAIFDPLTMVDNEGAPQPWLATSWENVDPTTWRFTLRDDVTFSNGVPLDADAVVATVQWLTGEAGRATVVGGELDMLSGARAVDPKTVEITTSVPEAILPSRLTAMYIVEPGAWAELGPDGFAAAPVGTGPFTVDAFSPESVAMTANPTSWRPPKVDSLSITRLADPAARVQALQSGQLDMAISLSPDQVEGVQASGATVFDMPAPQVLAMAFVQTHADSPIADVRVRQALNYAVDKNAIATTLLAGLGKPATQGATTTTFGYDAAVPGFPYDPDRARQLLAEAGHPDGFSMAATVTVGSFPGDAEIYQATVEYLRQVGVQVELETVQFPQWLDRYNASNWPGDMFNLSWNTAPIGDAIRPAIIFSCEKSNPFFCSGTTVSDLIAKANAEFDPEARRGVLAELAAANQADPPSLLLVDQVDLNATTAQTQGFRMDNRFVFYEDMTVQ